MADNKTGLNAQYDPGQTPFGLRPAIASTGAEGTPSASPDSTYGPVVGSPVVSTPYASSQVPANMPRVGVTAGDTSGMSSDAVVSPATGDPMTGLSLAQLTTTGAGSGGPQMSHPNSTNGGR